MCLGLVGSAQGIDPYQLPSNTKNVEVRTTIESSKGNGRRYTQFSRVLKIAGVLGNFVKAEKGTNVDDIKCPFTCGTKIDCMVE
jgi:hypothetical protein